MPNCIVCEKPLEYNESTYFPLIRCYVCNDESCGKVVRETGRDYSRSKRGRWRKPTDWQAAIAAEKAAIKIKAEAERKINVHVRWMIRRDLPDVFSIEASNGGAWSEEDFLCCLRKRNCIGMVAEYGENIIGFMVYELHKYKLNVLTMGVDKARHRRGAGSAMVKRLQDKLSSYRRTSITFTLYETATDFLMFLKHHGFTPWMARGSDLIEMTWRLPGCEPEPANRIAAFFDDATA